MLLQKFLFCCSLLSVIATCGCSMTITNGYRFDFKGEKDTGTLDVEIPPEAATLDLTNLHGDVTITTSTDGTSSLHWDIACWADTKEEAKRQLERIPFTSSMEGDVFKCEVILPTEDKELLRGVKSNVTIVLPESIAVNVHNSHGDVSAKQVDSRVELNNRHGNTQIVGLSQPCKITSAHGNIEMNDVVAATVRNAHGDTLAKTCRDSIELWNAHGSITVQDAMQDVRVETSHDDIFLTNVMGHLVAANSHGSISGTQLTGSQVEAECSFGTISLVSAAVIAKCLNQHGDIKLTSTNSEFGEITVKTSFGDAAIGLPSDCQPNLDTSCTFGDVKSDFENAIAAGPILDINVKHGDIRVFKQQTAERE